MLSSSRLDNGHDDPSGGFPAARVGTGGPRNVRQEAIRSHRCLSQRRFAASAITCHGRANSAAARRLGSVSAASAAASNSSSVPGSRAEKQRGSSDHVLWVSGQYQRGMRASPQRVLRRQVPLRTKPQPPPGYSGQQSSFPFLQACVVTQSSPDSDKFQCSCTDGYRPGGVYGPHGPPLLKHSTKRAPARASGKADRTCRGRSQAPGAGDSTPEINSPATAAATMKLPEKGNQPFRINPTSSRSEVDPIRDRSPTHRQNALQPNRPPAVTSAERVCGADHSDSVLQQTLATTLHGCLVRSVVQVTGHLMRPNKIVRIGVLPIAALPPVPAPVKFACRAMGPVPIKFLVAGRHRHATWQGIPANTLDCAVPPQEQSVDAMDGSIRSGLLIGCAGVAGDRRHIKGIPTVHPGHPLGAD